MKAVGAALSIVLALCALGCGLPVSSLEAFDVTLTPRARCTLTGATTRSCTDEATLAERSVQGRWIFENASDNSFTVTTELGVTIPGISFDDDGVTFNQAPCTGEGGLCYFARRRFDSTDPNDGCTRQGELVIIVRRPDVGTFSGLLSDVTTSDDLCGTSTISQSVDDVSATLSSEPALARSQEPS